MPPTLLQKLYVDKETLNINALLLGDLEFQSQDIISIEPITKVPILGQGIKIIHRLEKYNPEVIFWTFKDPNSVIDEIRKTGFLDNINSVISPADTELFIRQEQRGFPIKKPVVIILGVLWNALFLWDFLPFILQNEKHGIPFGNGVKMALGLAFISSILTLISEPFRKIILKEGREFSEIKKLAYFIMIISGMMLLSLMTFNFNG